MWSVMNVLRFVMACGSRSSPSRSNSIHDKHCFDRMDRPRACTLVACGLMADRVKNTEFPCWTEADISRKQCVTCF